MVRSQTPSLFITVSETDPPRRTRFSRLGEEILTGHGGPEAGAVILVVWRQYNQPMKLDTP